MVYMLIVIFHWFLKNKPAAVLPAAGCDRLIELITKWLDLHDDPINCQHIIAVAFH